MRSRTNRFAGSAPAAPPPHPSPWRAQVWRRWNVMRNLLQRLSGHLMIKSCCNGLRVRNGNEVWCRSVWGPVVVLLATTSCSVETGSKILPTQPREEIADLVLELTLGDEIGAPSEYQFSSIRTVLAGSDGSVWILDGNTFRPSPMAGGETPYLRRFDRNGTFLGYVGGDGDGPGEYRQPYRLGLMTDGRVALRDAEHPGRITIYTPDGELDTTWSLGPDLRATISPGEITVDASGVLWLDAYGLPDNGQGRSGSGFVRVQPDGTILDTIPDPLLPVMERTEVWIVRTLPSGARSTRGIPVPYEPNIVWALSREGTFAVSRTDQYRVELVPALGADLPSRMITRDVEVIALPEAEWAATQTDLDEAIIAAGGVSSQIPEVPQDKPPIKSLSYTSDGRLMVWVSMSSRLRDGEWTEPSAFDLFDPEGGFTGRVVLPESFRLLHMKADWIWGVFRDEYEIESIRRYRVSWSAEGL